MAPRAIISYDDTAGDLDALALGRLLASAGAELILAYVRHNTEPDAAREQAEAAQAEALLDRGADWLDEPHAERRVIVNPSTADGLCMLASLESADIVVFGSDYRTPAGRVSPQRSAHRLLEGGVAAVAIAPANLRSRRDLHVRTVGVLESSEDPCALTTAHELATALGASLTSVSHGADLLVVGSRREAPHGRVMVSAQALGAIEDARVPVLVVPRGVAVRFGSPVVA
jgi:nucleotide-binding universal stress UspA family protein